MDEVCVTDTTQLSACTVTPKLMSNGMKEISQLLIQKIKLVQASVELKNTLSTHTHSHGY